LEHACAASQVTPQAPQFGEVLSGMHWLLPQQPWPFGHAPQFTLRCEPQLSTAVRTPQLARRRVQNCASVSDVHEQTLLAPQTCGDGHVPQLGTVRVTPQLSGAVTVPHCLPCRAQNAASVSLVHEQRLLAVQTTPTGQVPQTTVRVAPQLSVAMTAPHCLPCRAQNAASVSGVQEQTLFVLQTVGAVHLPQLDTVRRMPQLSLAVTVPQFFPSRAQNRALLSRVHGAARKPPASSPSAPGSVEDDEASESSGAAPGSTMGVEASRSSGRKVSAGSAAPQPAAASAIPTQAMDRSLDHLLDDKSRAVTFEPLFIWK